MSPLKDVIWNRKIDLIEGHRAKSLVKVEPYISATVHFRVSEKMKMTRK